MSTPLPFLTTISVTDASPQAIDADVLVLAAQRPGGADGADQVHLLVPEGTRLPGTSTGALEETLGALGFGAHLDEVLRLPADSGTTLLVVGVGQTLAWAQDPARDSRVLGADRHGVLRRAAGRATRALAGVRSAALALPASSEEDLRAVAEGALSGAYAWSARHPAGAVPLREIVILSDVSQQAAAQVLRRAEAVSRSVHLARDLVNEPPNILTPAAFAERAQSWGTEAGLGAEVLDERDLAAQGFGGILGVGQGSVNPPRLVHLTWSPAGAARTVALVGKGITFDSGGLSLKPALSMVEMKTDMAGAAAVLGAVLACAQLNLDVRVEAWLALAENLPGGGAQRPSDIVTMLGGTTVEITNTDAEGRLVMADALARAVQDAPDAVLDVATLTGAQIVALGDRTAAVMGTPALREAVVTAARRAGESFWPMPLPEHLHAELDSAYAGLRNANLSSRAGGMLTAGLFLREFVGEVPWAHLDIAGPAFNGRAPWGAVPTGGTGVGVATLVELLSTFV